MTTPTRDELVLWARRLDRSALPEWVCYHMDRMIIHLRTQHPIRPVELRYYRQMLVWADDLANEIERGGQ